MISKTLDHDGAGLKVRAAINAVFVANVNESRGDASATSEQHVVHRSRQTTATPPDEQEAPDE